MYATTHSKRCPEWWIFTLFCCQKGCFITIFPPRRGGGRGKSLKTWVLTPKRSIFDSGSVLHLRQRQINPNSYQLPADMNQGKRIVVSLSDLSGLRSYTTQLHHSARTHSSRRTLLNEIDVSRILPAALPPDPPWLKTLKKNEIKVKNETKDSKMIYCIVRYVFNSS